MLSVPPTVLKLNKCQRFDVFFGVELTNIYRIDLRFKI